MKTAVIILAAGQGKRMRSDLPKPLLPLLGRSLIDWVLEAVAESGVTTTPILVVGHGEAALRAHLEGQDVRFVVQTERLGTGHALQQCLQELDGYDRVLVLSGDVPLVSASTISALVDAPADAVVAGFEADDPAGYGRLLCDSQGGFERIVEHQDADEAILEVTLVNAGLYVFPVAGLAERLAALTNDNAQGEYYITGIPEAVARDGGQVAVVEVMDPIEVSGINTPIQLAGLVEDARFRVLEAHLENGVLIDDPLSTWIEPGTAIAPGARILPHCVIRRNVTIGPRCEVGPFAHLREGTVLEEGAQVGNFMEVKNSTLGPDVRAKHLSYIGDARIGARTNVGAGTVFANYDGQQKHVTDVAEDVFIGSGTVLVAPVTVGARAKTGAGAVVTSQHDVADDDVVVGVPARSLSRLKEGPA